MPVELSTVLYQPIDACDADRRRIRRCASGRPSNTRPRLYGKVAAQGWSEHPEVMPYIQGFAKLSLRARPVSSPSATASRSPRRRCSCTTARRCSPARARCPRAAARARRTRCSTRGYKRRHRKGCDLAMMVAAPGSASQRNAERRDSASPTRARNGFDACRMTHRRSSSARAVFSRPTPPRSRRASTTIAEQQAEKAKQLGVEGPSEAETDRPARAAVAAAQRRRRPLSVVRQRLRRHRHGPRRRLPEAPREGGLRQHPVRHLGEQLDDDARHGRGARVVARQAAGRHHRAVARCARRVVLRRSGRTRRRAIAMRYDYKPIEFERQRDAQADPLRVAHRQLRASSTSTRTLDVPRFSPDEKRRASIES